MCQINRKNNLLESECIGTVELITVGSRISEQLCAIKSSTPFGYVIYTG